VNSKTVKEAVTSIKIDKIHMDAPGNFVNFNCQKLTIKALLLNFAATQHIEYMAKYIPEK
jgi:hypothetical protein